MQTNQNTQLLLMSKTKTANSLWCLSFYSKMNFMQKCDYYVRQIENYCGSDPLEYWHKYSCWLEKNVNNSQENKSILEEIFCKCLSIFEKVEKYKQDIRLIQIFIKYVSQYTSFIINIVH